MALPVVESSQTASILNSTSLSITKPTGLAAGDRLLAFIKTIDASTHTVNTPSGWTQLQQINGDGPEDKVAAFSKVADSADVSASNFTFTFTVTANNVLGALLRISNAPVASSSNAQSATGSSTTLSFTNTVTPLTVENLVIACFMGHNGDGTSSMASYASTPARTWTEIVDFWQNDGAIDPVMAVASAPGSNAQITAWEAVVTPAKSVRSGIIVVIEPVTNVTADVSHNAVTPAISGVTASKVLVVADIGHTEAEPDVHGIATKESSPQWTDQTKGSATWTNEVK
jgi:hypothetical protein